ncbi:conserved hypothetical protein, secreted [Candidatus Magnetomorum sp. HK-1]|nr:conserved hypothetical protein, secreted [Candidatus Magnetomorum sp. HK-1]
MKKDCIISTIICFFLIVSSLCAFAGTEATRSFIIRANNDFFKRSKNPSSDRRYTHGSSFGYINKANSLIEKFIHKDASDEFYSSLILLQDIYTPDDTEAIVPPDNEHPYSGEIDLIFGLHLRKKNSDKLGANLHTLYSAEVSLGATGTYSFAENCQKGIHRMINNDIPQGWEHQLASHFSTRLSMAVKRRISYMISKDLGLAIQAIGHIGGDLGNTLVQVATGGEIRLGWNLPDDFGTFAQGPGSIASNIQGVNGVLTSPGDRYGFYMILMAEGKYVNYNYHIGEKVAPIREVGELGIGWGFAKSRVYLPAFKFELCYIHRTEDFEEQDGPHRYGTASLVFPLN